MRIRRSAPILLLSLVLLLPLPVAAQHFPADDDLRLMLRYLVEDGEAPGIVLGVLEADGSTRVVGYGSGGAEAGAVGPRSVFEVGSITKTFTATLLADMVLRGEVALEDPVAIYLPAQVRVPAAGGAEITLLSLATHRSGLPSVPEDLAEERAGGDPSALDYTVEDAYAFLSTYELPRRPGSAHEYSNFGYGLLGHALGRAAGRSYRELVRTRILEPLGMDRSGFAGDDGLSERTTRGHRGGEEAPSRVDLEIFEGAGALHSTAEDLLAYIQAHVGPPETALERAMRFAMEVRVPRGDDRGGLGLAWSTAIFPGEAAVVAHGGGTFGYRTRLFFMPERGIGTVVLANDNTFDDDAFARDLLYIDPAPPEWSRTEVAPEVLAEYAGEYESVSGEGRYYIRVDDEGVLSYQPRNQVRTPLIATSDHTFYMLRGPWSLTFTRDADGRVLGMNMEVDAREPGQAGRTRAARKVGEETPPPAVVAGNAGFWTAWGAGVWTLIGLLGAVSLGLVLRPLWARRGAS